MLIDAATLTEFHLKYNECWQRSFSDTRIVLPWTTSSIWKMGLIKAQDQILSSFHLIFFIFILTEDLFILLNKASGSIAIRCHLLWDISWLCYESSSLLCTVAEPLWAEFVSFCISRYPMSSDRWCSIDVKLHFAAHSAISQIWITSSVKYFKAEIAKIKSTPKVCERAAVHFSRFVSVKKFMKLYCQFRKWSSHCVSGKQSGKIEMLRKILDW